MSRPRRVLERGSPSRRGIALTLLALAVLLHAALLWRVGAHRVDLEHDSTISVLAATGHEGDYARLRLGSWPVASEIQRLFRVDDAWPLRRIRDDLARHDVHPPLYFWLLHAQFLATGATPWASLVLNGILDLLTLLTMYSIGRRLWDEESAAAAAILWAVSDGAFLTAAEARPYALLALFALLLVRLALAVREPGRGPSLAHGLLMITVMALGLLTHFQFALMIVAVGTAPWWRVAGVTRARWLTLLALPLISFGIFAVLDPGFLASWRRLGLQAQVFAWNDVVPRLRHFLIGLEGLARPAHPGPWLAGSGALLLAWFAWRARRESARQVLTDVGDRLRGMSPAAGLLTWTALSCAALEGLLYVAHVSPAHAAGGRYNAMLWPLFALLCAGAAGGLRLPRAAVPALALVVFLVSYSEASKMDAEQRSLAGSRAWQALSSARALVADHGQRGVLPRTVLRIPADTPVFIVAGPTDIGSLPGGSGKNGVPVTFVLNREFGDVSVRRGLDSAGVAGDTVESMGLVPGGTEVVVWTPRRPR